MPRRLLQHSPISRGTRRLPDAAALERDSLPRTARGTQSAVWLLLLLPLAAACAREKAATAVSDTLSVAVAPAEAGDNGDVVTATGTYGARDEIPLAFKIGGVIARIDVDAGQSVRRGQRLAALDLREIDALLNKATIGLDKAARDEARVHRLFDDSVATRVQWQDAVSARDAAQADLNAAKVNREFAVIVAPNDGIILTRSAMPGANTSAGTTVVTLGSAGRGNVLRVGLSDRDALRTRIGDSATIEFQALPSDTFRGAVTLLDRASDARTGTYTAEITLRGDGAQLAALPSGLVGRVYITTHTRSAGITIPVDALLEAHADSAMVFTVADIGKPIAVLQRVGVRAVQGDRVSVTGIAIGTHVITRGAPYVNDGMAVRIAEKTP